MQWMVTDGDATARVEAADPGEAFRLASGIVNIDRARAMDIKYENGIEMVGSLAYRMESGAVLCCLVDNLAVTDIAWTDPEATTPGFGGEPADPEKRVIMLGYGLSRPMVYRWTARHPDAEIWTLNADRFSGASRHFQIHNEGVLEKTPSGDRIRDTSDLPPNVIVYNMDNFGFDSMRRNYFCSTVDYMLALADYEGFGEVYMPGLDFGGVRRAIEMNSARYWIGVLEGKGCVVQRSPMSIMFRHLRYGAHTAEELEAYEGEINAGSPRKAGPVS